MSVGMPVAFRGSDPALWWVMTTIGSRELSPRQREILALVAAGRTSKEIAGQLQISESTVNWHLANAFERLGASSRAEAVALAMRDGAEPADGGSGSQVAPPRLARHPTLPLSSIGLAFAATLLLGLIGGALIADWELTSPSPSPTAAPTGAPSPSTSPTAQPTGGAAPGLPSETAAQRPSVAPAPTSAGAPALRTAAPLLPAVASPEIDEIPPAPLDALPSLPAVPAPPSLLRSVP